MISDDFRSMIPGHLSGQLTASEAAMFEAKLSDSSELRLELEELRASWQELGLLPEEQPSAALRARFYQTLNDLNRGRSRSQPATGYAWWKPGLSGLIRQSTIVLALFCMGVYVGRVSLDGRQPTGDVAQLEGQVQGLRQAVALSLMDRQSATSRLEGISWSSRVANPDRDLLSALIGALNHDPNTNVRLASLDALEKFSSDAAVRQALVSSLPIQDSPLVQIALIDGLVQMRDKAAAKEFRTLSRNAQADGTVRQRAQWGLQRLSF